MIIKVPINIRDNEEFPSFQFHEIDLWMRISFCPGQNTNKSHLSKIFSFLLYDSKFSKRGAAALRYFSSTGHSNDWSRIYQIILTKKTFPRRTWFWNWNLYQSRSLAFRRIRLLKRVTKPSRLLYNDSFLQRSCWIECNLWLFSDYNKLFAGSQWSTKIWRPHQ